MHNDVVEICCNEGICVFNMSLLNALYINKALFSFSQTASLNVREKKY